MITLPIFFLVLTTEKRPEVHPTPVVLLQGVLMVGPSRGCPLELGCSGMLWDKFQLCAWEVVAEELWQGGEMGPEDSLGL